VKGDFSRVRFARDDNFNGILPQQGKVLLDSDGIAQTLIENDWRETAARDWVGTVAGVPAAIPNSFKVTAASLTGGVVELAVDTGHLWADGLLVRLDSPSGAVNRTATWIEPPLVPTEGDATNVAVGVMDAVILEVWQHAINGFQAPDKLIEPALGGPDTAERLQTSFAFRLARLNAGQTCSLLAFNESGRGRLTASLVPPVTVAGDCPVEGSGGYSGFEHQLYRIEIADSSAGASQFKWSRLNSGLVGRGAFDPASQTIAITANLPAITGVNQTSFYLEIEQYDTAAGYSRVVAGAQATLTGSTLQLPAAPAYGAYPAAGTAFFRLWDGISLVSAFPISTTPGQLENGILLQFDPDGVGKYYPGDYWMFPVRVQGISNPSPLIDGKPPQGIVYRRVALAEITWAGGAAGSFTAGAVQDCRTIVQPLSRIKGCCSYRVGDGVTSFGDFTSIQTAVDSLPPEGGEVCLLPGLFTERVSIVGLSDIVIHGCGWQTRVVSPPPAPPPAGAAPINPISAVFTVANSRHIELRSFVIEAADTDAGILIDGDGTSLAANLFRAVVSLRGAIDVTIESMLITAATLPAILAEHVELLRVARNRVAMKNVRSLWPAIYVSGREIHVERNWTGIQSAVTDAKWLPYTVTTHLGAAAEDTTAPPAQLTGLAAAYVATTPVAAHPGGIQIGGPSTDVYVIENEIEGGSRNGIVLGSFEIVDTAGSNTLQWIGVLVTAEGDDCCTGTLQPPTSPTGGGSGTLVAGGLLTNIHIHRNRIRNMGLCGIGPVGFFDLIDTLEMITIDGLNVSGNSITLTLLRPLSALNDQQSMSIGYGAICVPDVMGLVVRDNAVTDFGEGPGARVCGILVVHGELIEISRNHILETRDWSGESTEETGSGSRGGIVILLGTPPTFKQPVDPSLWTVANQETPASALDAPVYEPGLPAVRIEHNVVRVPLNYALAILGCGPFEITNNHLACGGMVREKSVAIAQTVLILNLATAIELAANANLPSYLYKNTQASYGGIGAASFQNISSGAVSFTGNMCQLGARGSLQTELSSVFIVTPDHLIFSNNHCWLDSAGLSSILDALLIGGSLNVIGNRFQESVGAVFASGLTAGVVNVTGQNISTYCLFVLGSRFSDNNNLTLLPGAFGDMCSSVAKDLSSALAQ
jgi:Family of unknown function (DUF6519)